MLAIEELRHFRAVHEQLLVRGLTLTRDSGDPYAQRLLKQARHGRTERLVDRLLLAGLIEARSNERLELLAEALPEPAMREFYRGLARAEAGHAQLFLDLALQHDKPDTVRGRLAELARAEAEIVAELPIEPRIH